MTRAEKRIRRDLATVTTLASSWTRYCASNRVSDSWSRCRTISGEPFKGPLSVLRYSLSQHSQCGRARDGR